MQRAGPRGEEQKRWHLVKRKMLTMRKYSGENIYTLLKLGTLSKIKKCHILEYIPSDF